MNDTTTPIQNSSSEYLKFADLIFNINSPEPDLPRALITAHLSPDILRASGTNHATHCAIGKDFLKTYSRDSTQALRTLVTKFHLRLNDDLLKSKSTRAGYSLRHLTILENDGKALNHLLPVTHFHSLIEVPPTMSTREFNSITRSTFQTHIAPRLDIQNSNFNSILAITFQLQFTLDDDRDSLTEYLLKQSRTFELASDRILFHIPRKPLS